MANADPVDLDETLLTAKLEELERLRPASRDVRDLLESFVRTARDELVCINPVAFADGHEWDEAR